MASLRSEFKLSITDPCQTATLLGELAPQAMAVEAGNTSKYTQSVAVLSDSISWAFGVQSECGPIQYLVLSPEGYTAPDYVSLTYIEGGSTFDIEVDMKDYYGAAQTLNIKVRATLQNYAQFVPSLTTSFELKIEVTDPFVFVPPAPKPEPKPAPEPPVPEPETTEPETTD